MRNLLISSCVARGAVIAGERARWTTCLDAGVGRTIRIHAHMRLRQENHTRQQEKLRTFLLPKVFHTRADNALGRALPQIRQRRGPQQIALLELSQTDLVEAMRDIEAEAARRHALAPAALPQLIRALRLGSLALQRLDEMAQALVADAADPRTASPDGDEGLDERLQVAGCFAPEVCGFFFDVQHRVVCAERAVDEAAAVDGRRGEVGRRCGCREGRFEDRRGEDGARGDPVAAEARRGVCFLEARADEAGEVRVSVNPERMTE
jgi:hypothetical protein